MIKILTWLWGFRVTIGLFSPLLLSRNSQKRLEHKENQTKYVELSRKPRGHVKILIYRTWAIKVESRWLYKWEILINIYQSSIKTIGCFYIYLSRLVIAIHSTLSRRNANLGQELIRGTQRQFSENICSEGDLRSRIFGTFFVKFLACLPLLGFSNV